MPITIQTGSTRDRESDLDKLLKGLSIIKTGLDSGVGLKKLIGNDPEAALRAEQLKKAQRENKGLATIPELLGKGFKASPLVTGAPPAPGAPASPIAASAPGASPLTRVPKGGMVTRGILPTGEEGDLVLEPVRDPSLSLNRLGTSYEYRDSLYQKRNQDRVHNEIVRDLKRDKNLGSSLANYKTLDNALSIITKSKHITPQQIHEFQQAVRGAIGIKGQGGVSEREATYLDSIGLRADAFKQFLTGEPESIAKDSKIIEHFKELATMEQQNLQTQKDQRIEALISGHEDVYDERPDLKKSLDNAINAIGKQFVSTQPPEPPPFDPAAAARAELERRRVKAGGK